MTDFGPQMEGPEAGAVAQRGKAPGAPIHATRPCNWH